VGGAGESVGVLAGGRDEMFGGSPFYALNVIFCGWVWPQLHGKPVDRRDRHDGR